jgi:hypothetical protein
MPLLAMLGVDGQQYPCGLGSFGKTEYLERTPKMGVISEPYPA